MIVYMVGWLIVTIWIYIVNYIKRCQMVYGKRHCKPKLKNISLIHIYCIFLVSILVIGVWLLRCTVSVLTPEHNPIFYK